MNADSFPRIGVSTPRGHGFMVRERHNLKGTRGATFPRRVVGKWNELPEEAVDAGYNWNIKKFGHVQEWFKRDMGQTWREKKKTRWASWLAEGPISMAVVTVNLCRIKQAIL